MKISTQKTWLAPAVFVLLSALSAKVQAQDPLDSYISEGLEKNLVINQKKVSAEQARNALQAARSYFMPSVTLLGDYLSGQGGRAINLPIGDLLNPVYSSLNQLTGSDQFPQIQNVREDFFPRDQYDARIRTSVPILNTDIIMNRAIQAQQSELRDHEVQLYARQLVCDIKTSYYNYLRAEEAVKIYQSALALVEKNVEVNESLVRNGSGTPASLMRSRSEAEKIRAELNSARNQSVNARRYFNFLLNRDLDTAINTNFTLTEPEATEASENSDAIIAREELQILRTAQQINTTSLKMNQLNRAPKISAFLDLGSQASRWQFNDQSRYYLAGVQVSVPLFQGFRNNINIRNSHLAIDKTAREIQHAEAGISLAIATAKNDYNTTIANYHAAKEQLRSAESYFRLIDKGFQQGVNSLIEYIDARNQLTSSQLQVNLSVFQLLIAEARLERETASYPVNK